MSFNIDSVSAAAAARAAAGQVSDAKHTTATGAHAMDEAVHVDTFPSTPPSEVHDAIAVASQAPDRLAAQNRAMHFHIDDRTGRLSVEVHDLQGNVLFTVPASKALDVAAGGNLE
jgi:hypothetical protein